MTDYWRPVAMTDPAWPAGALTLAGGWCWFDRAERLGRDGRSELCPVSDIPKDVRDRLTAPRLRIADLPMDRPQVMGILNVTPDSFSDGGDYAELGPALARALAMVRDGARIVDIGGESTRPGAEDVDPALEEARTAPVIAALRGQSDVAISIDTRKAGVARAAVAAGATLINDVAALTWDDGMAAAVQAAGVPVCLMHAQGDPQTMQDDPRYDDVLLDVYDFLSARVGAAVGAGIPREHIVVDPGIGFGKTAAHNVALIRGLSLFHGLGCPILLGASRKRFTGTLGSAPQAKDRVGGSLSVALSGVRQGVQILRVHDTLQTRQAVDLAMAIEGQGR